VYESRANVSSICRRVAPRAGNNSIAAVAGGGVIASSVHPARSKNPPARGRIVPISPIRLLRNLRLTNATTAPLARSIQCRSSTTISGGPFDAA
jgi:hypothetical protein